MPIAQTTISGTAYDEQGNPVSGVTLKVIKAVKSGVVIQLKARTIATSNASGVFERSEGVADFLLPRNSTVWLKGKCYIGSTLFDKTAGVAVVIPDAATATLESLGAAATVPVQGVTVVGLPNLIGTFDFGDGLSVTETPTGTAVIDASVVAPVNAQTGTTYLLVPGDNGKIVTLSNVGAITVTVPAGLGAGFNCVCIQMGAGQVTFVANVATLTNRQSQLKIAGQWGTVSILAPVANALVLSGDTAA